MNLDFNSLAQELLSQAETLLREWFPAGKRQGREYVVGSLDGEEGSSLSINTQSGAWSDFATGQVGGDLISLYAAANNITQGEAFKQLANASSSVSLTPKPKKTEQRKLEYKIIMPVPESAPEPNFHHYLYGNPTATWAYLDGDGNDLGYMARYDPPDTRKQFIPWVWAEGKGWTMKQFPEPRPMYGLHRLAERPETPALLVEGEKAADAAQAIAGHIYVVVTWPGGAKAAHKVDWSPLHGRKILMWPDADDAGRQAMLTIAEQLDKKTVEIKVIDTLTQPEGWDAADALAEGWDWKAFKAWASPRAAAFVVPEPPPLPKAPITENKGLVAPKVSRSVDYYGFLPNCNDKGKPQSTIENLQELCRRLGVIIRYNVISKEEEILIPDQSYSVDNKANASIAWLISECAKFGMPVGQIDSFVTYMADQNLYNPVAQWITSKPWDGVDRIKAICATIKGENDHDEKQLALKNTLIRRWMISAVAAAFEPLGVSAHGILVIQGSQYIGKTKWFKSLVPADMNVIQDGMILRPDDRDSVKQTCSFWLVELGELDATFRKSDIAQLKSFITRQQDVLRRAYARKESTYARRTVFFGSVNPREFLHDPTGNRRYWTISATEIDHSHNIDQQQMWAQVYEEYKMGEGHYLLPEEMEALNMHNEGFSVVDPIEDRLRTRLAWDESENLWTWKTATDILLSIGVDRPNQADATKCATLVRKMNKGQSKRSNGKNLLRCPSLVNR